MQAIIGAAELTIEVPDADEEVMPGIRWGRFDHFFTPAFWLSRVRYEQASRELNFAFGESVLEEVVACLLGGYGFRAETGVAAFVRLRDRDLLRVQPHLEKKIHCALSEPLLISDRHVCYRYPHQRARFITAALHRMADECAPTTSAVSFRNWLTTFEGIGLKTASWITRNALRADTVAILDVHILRAGVLANIFQPPFRLPRDYIMLESRLIEFACSIGVRLSILDAVMWHHMRCFGPLARNRSL
jgi:thermostable 8-oxoguanine DNA glycosylase